MTAKQTSRITFLAGSFLIIALALHFFELLHLRNGILITSTVIAAVPIALKAIQALRMRAFSIQLLVTIAVIGALIIGEFVESAAVTFLFLFGGYLEARTLEKTRTSLKKLMNLAPQTATVARDGEWTTIPSEVVSIGDRIRIRSGEKVPVDGVIITGQASLNEAAITGEAKPTYKTIDDTVIGGTILENGFIEMMAERVGDDTTFAKMIELIEEAQEAKAKTEKFLDRFSNIYTPSIIVLSVLVYIIMRDIHLTLTFLVVACPGALVISAPVSIVAGIGNGAKNGVLIKGGEMMEQLANIDVVVFDKTGTLTEGKPTVADIYTFTMDQEDLLLLAAEAEMVSEHHLGKTIVNEAQRRGLPLINQPEDVEILDGKGIRVQILENKLVIGNRNLLNIEGIPISQHAAAYAMEREKLGNTAVFVAIDGQLQGIISIADRIRVDAAETIQSLRARGIKKVIMLTGDNRHTAQLVGTQLALDEVHAELLPKDKVAIIEQLKKAGYRVAMAGDGINDAPAIAAANIGLAMGKGGTDVAMETADIVLMADQLPQFAHAYSLAKATIRNLKQNTFFAVGTVLLLLIGVLNGKILLASGMLIHELSVLLVILNAIRLTRYTSIIKS
ncbi:heavy metal translocating P-type ATPase [Paenibacillus yanchengensis]|uniref:Cd(2+)-exporting ATPase n=1 Tax=Paenibacillus yanchengensis TaxID=2035833 RepID=A0ABW4YF69_9BACL